MHKMEETHWLMMVARAAPFTPIPKPKIKIGSRMIFNTAPSTTTHILTVVLPWAVIKAFIPSVIWTNSVPEAYMVIYDEA